MRPTLILAALLAATGIGGTGHAAPRAPITESATRVVLTAAVDTSGPATPSAACADVAADDRASCRKLEAAVVDARRTLAVAELADGWSGARRVAFARLVAAQEAYARAVGTHEGGDGDGPAAEGLEKDAFLATLRAVLRGQPAPHAGSLESYDAELNVAYAHIMEARDIASFGAGLDKAGVRRTERAWLAYRDAFVAFAATLESPGAGEGVKAELTRRRAADLEALLAD